MATCQIRLRSRQTVAEATEAFHFEKPVGFAFKPGQAVDVVLSATGSLAGAEDPRHAFSIVSAPFEDELVVATRMRDTAFKRALGALSVGDVVEIDGPFGSLTLHRQQERAAVLIAGGIGITPFMSMLRQAAHDRLSRELHLIYSNRKPEGAPFLDELRQLAQTNPHFHLMATMTGMVQSNQRWTGLTQRVDRDLVSFVLRDLDQAVCYLAGPPGMVHAMQQTLAQAGVDEEDVRSEEFHGY